jgi:hypothetical protein
MADIQRILRTKRKSRISLNMSDNPYRHVILSVPPDNARFTSGRFGKKRVKKRPDRTAFDESGHNSAVLRRDFIDPATAVTRRYYLFKNMRGDKILYEAASKRTVAQMCPFDAYSGVTRPPVPA